MDKTQCSTRVRGWIKYLFSKVLVPVVTLVSVWWAIGVIFSAENKPTLMRLLEMPAGKLQLLLALSVATTFINGILFWVTLIPIKRISLVNVQAINAIADVAQPLPLGLGKVFRFMAHQSLDGLKTREIVVWFAIRAILVVIIPLSLWGATVIAGDIGIAWLSWVLVLLISINLAYWFCATWPRKILLILQRRYRVSEILLDCAEGLVQVLHRPWILAVNLLLSSLDFLVHALRFVTVCGILQCGIGFGDALVLSSWNFIAGLFLGAGLREGSISVLAEVLGHEGLELFLVASTVTVVELATNLLLALVGGGWLVAKIWRAKNGNGGDKGGNA